MTKTQCQWCFYGFVLLVPIWVLVGLNALLSPYIFPYPPDSASYIEMARHLSAGHAPLVTPWDPSLEPDAIAQRLFPPGYPILIALANGVVHDEARAAMWVVHLFAACIPLALVWSFDGLLSRKALAMIAALTLLSVGMVEMQQCAYSDVPALFFEVVAVGTLVRAYRQPPAALADGMGWWFAGLVMGFAVVCRNAALALVMAVLMWMALQWWREPTQRPQWARVALKVGAGIAIPMVLLWIYNWLEFHSLQPYTMPLSTRNGWHNAMDLARAVGQDLGIPLPLLPEPWCLAVVVVWWCLAVQGYWRLRREPLGGVVLLGLLYVGAHEVVLWLSRTRFEWGGIIEVRHTLSFSWAELWVLALVLFRNAPAPQRRQLAIASVLSLFGLMVAVAGTVDNWRRWGPEPWVFLDQDQQWRSQLPSEAPGTLVVSNSAPFFRVEMGLPVREWELGGDEDDAVASFTELDQLVGHRPTVLWLVCTPYTGRYAICGDHPERSTLRCEAVRTPYPKLWRCQTQVVNRAVTQVADR